MRPLQIQVAIEGWLGLHFAESLLRAQPSSSKATFELCITICGSGDPRLVNMVASMSRMPRVCRLSLRGLAPTGVQCLAEALEDNNSSLLALDLSGNSLDTPGAMALAKMLLVNTRLSSLVLRGERTMICRVKCAAHILLTNNTLTALDLGANEVSEDAKCALRDAKRRSEDRRSLAKTRWAERLRQDSTPH